MVGQRYCVIGGAGFIGSHFVDSLLGRDDVEAVTAFDNFSAGRRWHVAHHDADDRFRLVEGDIRDEVALTAAVRGHDTVVHLASNPDIAAAATEPSIDFDDGTLLTHHVVEAVRREGVGLLLYASGSGVYGDIGDFEADENFGPLVPVSTYAASKLAGESLISAYAHMFDFRGVVFRFGNVVGPRQTHGVGFDFVRRLRADGSRLAILGDGRQSKSYVHVDDVVQGVQHVAALAERPPFEVFNLATGDYVTVTEIAEIAVDCLGLDRGSVAFEYAGGDRGWKGDVPVVRLSSKRLNATGWTCVSNSAEALRSSILSMIDDDAQGRFD